MSILAILLAATITIDVDKSPIKDQRDSTCRPDLGYAGCLTEVSLYNEAFPVWAYGQGIKETEKALRACGARFIRQWNAVDEWQMGMAGHWNRANPRDYFSLWKKMGIKVLLTLENYSVYPNKSATGKKTSDIGTVKQTIGRYVKWIVDNRFKDVVAGFELGNEPYFGADPETFAERWCEILPEIRKHWPDVKIGMPIAEYRAGDPDLDAVRRRLGEKKMMPGGGEFEINRFNQWSGRFVTAMSNEIDNISHVVYHFYGGDAAYGCSASGFGRVHNFAKIYPQIAGKRVWISEWRERSDEDMRCHRMFFSTLWKAHYMLIVLAQPDVDGVNQHCIGCYSGGLNISMNCSFKDEPWRSGFHFQSDPAGGYNFYPDPDAGYGIRRYEVGPAGPLYRIYTDALMDHPIILEHGLYGKQGKEANFWTSALYYAAGNAERAALARGEPPSRVPRAKGNVEWIAALSGNRRSLALLMVNTTDEERQLDVVLHGSTFAGPAKAQTVSCPHEYVYYYSIPAEPPLWSEGTQRFTAVYGERADISIRPDTVQVVVFPLR
ncbi:MAG: hypothetical protein IJ983_05840 [Kiritimatiellae bacterium]|nr:hypothetical protein [Kiritimatiellia bacterium]